MKKRIFLLGAVISVFTYWKVDAQVNLHTGAAEYNIPLYSFNDPNNRISTAVTLVYTGGNGLKVSEIPSSVGAGWSLAFGGYIQRVQHGEADDQKNNSTYSYPFAIINSTIETNFHNWVDSYFPNGYLYSEYSPLTPVDNGGAYSPLFHIGGYKYKPHPKYQADLEQDVFSFNFNGRTGSFVIGKKNQNNEYPIRTLYDSKLKIEKIDGDLNNSNNIRTTISEFRITDENGIKYVFKDADLDQVCVYNKTDWHDQYGNYGGSVSGVTGTSANGGSYSYYANTSLPVQYHVNRANTKNAYTKNRWYLSEIINPLTLVKIQFIYETFDFDLDGNKIAQASRVDDKNTFSLLVERLKGTAKRLRRIILSSKESVEFNYSISPRIDIPADRSLDEIVIKYGEEVKSKWLFEQGYFVKNAIKAKNYSFTTEDKAWSRLCLQKVKKIGSGNLELPPYTFSYFMGNEAGLYYSAIPPLFSFYQDISGYYNVMNFGGFYNPTTHSSSSTNPPYEPFGGNLLPKDIYDPLSYLGDVNKRPSLEARNGVLKSISNPFGGSLTFEYEQHYFDLYTWAGNGGVRVNKLVAYDGLDHNNDIVTEYKYIKADGSSSAWGYDLPVFNQTSQIKIYKKCGNQKFPAINIPDQIISFQKFWNIVSSYKAAYRAGGYSMAEFRSDFGVGSSTELQVKSAINEVLFSVILSFIVDLFTSDYANFTVTDFKFQAYSAHSPLPFQYSRVEVLNKKSSDNIGKTVFEFTSPAEPEPQYAIDIPSLSAPYSAKQRYASWLYGLPRWITVFDKNGKIVKKTENYYMPVKYSLSSDPLFASQKWIPNKRTYDCPFSPNTGTGSNDINYDIYYPVCGRIDLQYTKEYLYNANSPQEFTSSGITYEYSSNNYLPNKTMAYNSKGELIETNTYYPKDYTLSGALQTMINNNIINVPVSSQTLITKTGNQKYLLAGDISEFGIAGNGDVKIMKTYSFQSENPVLSTAVPFNAAQLLPSSTLYKETGTVTYNNFGNTSQIKTNIGKVSSIYDYDNRMPIATIVNADINEVAYTSFESDGTGGWSLTPGFTILTQGGFTGKSSFSGTLQKSSLPSGSYTVTLWSLSGSNVTVNGQVGALVVTNGVWRLYEWKLNSVTSITIVADNVDEVRLCPSRARMTTVTYDPLIGKTSECDATNRVTYYEYDELGRLKVIRDENRNVIKAYEYNYKQ